MADETAKIDSNSRASLLGITDDASQEIRRLLVDPATGRLLVDATGSGLGDVVGPASSTDNAIARFDGITGLLLQNSGVTIDDAGTVTVNSSAADQIIFSGGTGTGSGAVSGITVSRSDTTLLLTGNRDANGGAVSDVIVESQNTRTTGSILRVRNNGSDRATFNFFGGLLLEQSAISGGSRAAFIIDNANHTNQATTVEVINFSIDAYTRQWATGTVALQREWAWGQPTYGFVGASTVTVATGFELSPPTAGTNATFAANYGLNLTGNVTMGPSTAASVYRGYRLAAQTITFTGTTQITSTVGVVGLMLNAPTVTNASAMTMDAAATMYVSGAPTVSGSAVITNAYAIWSAAGLNRFDGGILYQESVVSKTQAVSPYSVLTTESGRTFTNEGATSIVTFSLPTAAAGLIYSFAVQDADGIIVDANTGDTINIAGSVSATSGNATSTTIGSTLTLVAINATEWVAVKSLGTWVVT